MPNAEGGKQVGEAVTWFHIVYPRTQHAMWPEKYRPVGLSDVQASLLNCRKHSHSSACCMFLITVYQIMLMVYKFINRYYYGNKLDTSERLSQTS